MQFSEIYEKTKYAFEHDEVFELLMGEKGYAYQAPMVPASVPTHDDAIFDRGIYPYYNNSSNEEKQRIVEQITSVLQKMMFSKNPVCIWWALAIIFGQKLNEFKYKESPFFIADNLFSEIRQPLLDNKNSLQICKLYSGVSSSEGLWTDVMRYDSLCQKYFNRSLWW